MGSSSRRWLNQSTHSRVAHSTTSKLRRDARRWITSDLQRLFEAKVCYWSLNPDWEARRPWEAIGCNLHAPSPEDEDAAYRLWDMGTSRG